VHVVAAEALAGGPGSDRRPAGRRGRSPRLVPTPGWVRRGQTVKITWRRGGAGLGRPRRGCRAATSPHRHRAAGSRRAAGSPRRHVPAAPRHANGAAPGRGAAPWARGRSGRPRV